MAGSDHFYGRKNPGITVKFCDCLHLQEIFQKKEREDENMSETSVNQRKVAMIGCGFVGSATAFALMESGLFSEMVLIDADKNRAEGEALDISHGLPFARPMKIYAGDYDDIVDAAIIIVTAGANQKPDETRLDLVQKNVGIFKSIIPEIAKRNCGGILLIVSNPVDILTYTALKLSGFPENRVLGSKIKIQPRRASECGQPECARIHYRRTRRQRACSMEQRHCFGCADQYILRDARTLQP